MAPQPTPPTSASNPTFEIVTSAGTIRGQLFPKDAPISVANFAKYAKEGFYPGTIFHRVIKGFMIQGGGQTADGRQKKTGSAIKLEISPNLAHWDGALAMARTAVPDSATAQFYVCHGPQAGLDKNYAVFGLVTGGKDIVDKIASTPTDRSDKPKTDIVITQVTVTGV